MRILVAVEEVVVLEHRRRRQPVEVHLGQTPLALVMRTSRQKHPTATAR